jgi:hypothetical protein
MQVAPIKINDVEKAYISNQDLSNDIQPCHRIREHENLRSAKIANNDEPNHHNR